MSSQSQDTPHLERCDEKSKCSQTNRLQPFCYTYSQRIRYRLCLNGQWTCYQLPHFLQLDARSITSPDNNVLQAQSKWPMNLLPTTTRPPTGCKTHHQFRQQSITDPVQMANEFFPPNILSPTPVCSSDNPPLIRSKCPMNLLSTTSLPQTGSRLIISKLTSLSEVNQINRNVSAEV